MMLPVNALLRSRTTTTLLAIGILVAPVAFTGCSSTSTPLSAGSKGPLDEYMSQLRMSQEASDEAAKAEHERAEELTAQCMSEEGFDYTPWPFTEGPIAGGLSGRGPSSGTDAEAEKFANTYGYGIVEDPNRDAENLDGDAQGQDLVDINGDYINSLTESEQEAYREALNGPPLSEEEVRGGGEDGIQTVPVGRGCAGESRDQARSEQTTAVYVRDDPDFHDLFEAERRLNESLNPEAPSDEDVIALNALWNQCMTKVGHSVYDSPLSAQNSLGEEFEQLEADSEDLNQELSTEEKDRFQTLEVEVASADLSCRASVSYEAELTRITHDREQDFVDAHKTTLEALVARYGSPAEE